MEAEFDVRMHEIELAMSEHAVEEAKVEIEKVGEHVVAAQRQREPSQRALASLELEQARIRLAMQKLRSEMARLNLERTKARLQVKKSTVTEKPKKRHRVQLEYVDDLDVVIIRGSKEGVDKIRALIESAEKEKDD
jgi:cell division protein FtsB